MKHSSFTATRRLLLLLVLVTTVPGQAQTAPAKAAADSSSATLGFSIESEMLTYRALESNSEAVACDISGYLNGTTPDFNNVPAGSVCEVRAGSHNASVVLLPFDRSPFTDFQYWREDMVKMDQLQRAAAAHDCPPGSKPRAAAAAASAASSALNLTPAGPMLNAAQGVLGLLASEESTSAVKGTVEDQAFLDGVGRQLRALKVPVIMPPGYSPYSLMPVDRSSSPFLASYDRMLIAEACLAQLPATNDADKDSIRSTIAEIDKFRNMLEEPATSKTTSTAGTAEATKTPGGSATSPTATIASDHLLAVLSGDGLAQALGVDPGTGKIQDNGASQHILLLKALESGGSVSRSSNILGTKLRYSGGFVGTFALFSMAGDLECSGNVFEFGGSIKAKNFEKDLNNYKLDPQKQMIFQRGSCLSSAPRR